MLDVFGNYQADILSTQTAFRDMAETAAAYQALIEAADKAEQDRDFLSFAVEELDRLDARSGEVEELAAKRRFLQGAEGALSELAGAETTLGDGEYESRLSSALAGVDRVRDKIGDTDSAAENVLRSASGALERALLEIQEARQSVAQAASAFDVQPGALDEAEKRLFAIKAACRKYGVESEALSDKRREFAGDLALIDNVDAELSKAKAKADKAEALYLKSAKKLTKARIKASKKLETAVLKEMPALKMERAQFEVSMAEGPNSAMGQDKVRFQVATNPGSAMGPMDKVASGGELARFALAIKVALANRDDKVMVFDEVDQGVGGAVASAVGSRLAKLSSIGQVFVVTHSPQVAACADHQYLIEKASKAKTTITSVKHVLSSDREEEIARMLAGESITDEARAAARRLMKAS